MKNDDLAPEGKKWCPHCAGFGMEPGWRCGCGRGVYHVVACGRPAPNCQVCGGSGLVDFDFQLDETTLRWFV